MEGHSGGLLPTGAAVRDFVIAMIVDGILFCLFVFVVVVVVFPDEVGGMGECTEITCPSVCACVCQCGSVVLSK